MMDKIIESIVEFQKVLYNDEPDDFMLNKAIGDISDYFAPNLLTHELITACSLKHDLIPHLANRLKGIDYDWVTDQKSSIFIYKLFKYGIISQEIAMNKLPDEYFARENGQNVSDDYDTQIDASFGGPLAAIIARDDIEALQQYVIDEGKSFSFDSNLTLLYDTITKISLLSYSARRKAIRCFKFLLVNGAKPDSAKNSTAEMASGSGQIEMLKILDERGFTFSDDCGGAAAKYHQNVVLDWLANTKGINMNSAVQSAAKFNNFYGVQIALNAGADINSTSQFGLSPIHFASLNAHELMVQYLLKLGSNVNNCTDAFGLTPLHEASLQNNAGIIDILLKAGAEINAQDKKGMTPVILAAQTGNLESLKVLIDARADINIGNLLERTALYCAVMYHQKESARLLIKAGAICTPSKSGNSPVLLAYQQGGIEFVQIFLDEGIDPKTKFNNGKTFLHLAVELGDIEAIEFFLKLGLNPNQQDEKGITPYLIASQRQNQQILKCMEAYLQN